MTKDDLELALHQKREKAQKYASEPERFRILGISLSMKSNHDTRTLTFLDGDWKCTCDFYQETGTCSHIMAIKEILESARLECRFD